MSGRLLERMCATSGVLLATGGGLFILSFGPEAIGLVHPEREGQIVNFPLYAFFTGLMVVATALLGVGLWRMRTWASGIGRIGRVGLYLCIASFAGIGLTALTAFVSAVRTAQPPGYTFVFFALGLLFSVVGPILLGTGLRHVRWLGPGRFLPFAIAGGTILAWVPTDPWHDIGLLILALSWAGLGAAMLLRRPGEEVSMLNHRATLLQTVIRRLGPAPVDDIERRALLTFGTATFTLTMASPAAQYPARQIPVAFLHFLGAASFGLFLCLFPDGRFVPRWTGWVALV